MGDDGFDCFSTLFFIFNITIEYNLKKNIKHFLVQINACFSNHLKNMNQLKNHFDISNNDLNIDAKTS